jgi:hypothetical protein
MSVVIRPYRGRSDAFEVDITVLFPDGTKLRERKKSPVTSKSGSKRWAEDRKKKLEADGPPQLRKEVPTFETFSKTFMDGHPIANRHKPSGIAAKEPFSVHLNPFPVPSDTRDHESGCPEAEDEVEGC